MSKKMENQMDPMQTVALARHKERPNFLEYISRLFDDFLELHGDRYYSDDPAIVGGMAKFDGQPVIIIGHQKGKGTKDNIYRNFGMAQPEGYRKAKRLMRLAAKFKRPIISFIDTPGAYPGIGAEERGQAEAIAQNLKYMAELPVPFVAVVTGEGGSGGALGIGVANRVLMLENSVYSVISPEGCASILFRDASRAKEAAENMRITAPQLLKLKVIDEIIKEPTGGAHENYDEMATNLKKILQKHLTALSDLSAEELIEDRYQKFRNLGIFEEGLI